MVHLILGNSHNGLELKVEGFGAWGLMLKARSQGCRLTQLLVQNYRMAMLGRVWGGSGRVLTQTRTSN